MSILVIDSKWTWLRYNQLKIIENGLLLFIFLREKKLSKGL